MTQNPYEPPKLPSDTPVQASITAAQRRQWALACWLPFGASGAASLLLQGLGQFDPRIHDGMVPDVYPLYVVLIWLYTFSSAFASVGILCAFISNARRATIVLWLGQGLALVLFAVLAQWV